MAIIRRTTSSSPIIQVTNPIVEPFKYTISNEEEEYPKHWVSAGCPTMNLALSGRLDRGYVVGRTVNLIGDYSSGKTLLLCELINNLWHVERNIKGKKVRIRYNEPENKFDYDRAKLSGTPINDIEWVHTPTVEAFYDDFGKTVSDPNKADILLYGLDSLDALGNAREQKKTAKKGIGKQDYKVGVATIMSNLFKDFNEYIKSSNCIFFVVSQLRAKINAGFWERPYTRSGGNALNFFATQIGWLREDHIIKHDNGIVQGIAVELAVEKNHVYVENRKAQFNIIYRYGVDYVGSVVDYALENKVLVPSGSWYEWNGKKFQGQSGLVPFFEKDKGAYQELMWAVQNKWDEMEAEAQIVRAPKWPVLQGGSNAV
jgi:RecA/RadA recombinase